MEAVIDNGGCMSHFDKIATSVFDRPRMFRIRTNLVWDRDDNEQSQYCY
jgi:hypothetical protein